MAQPILKERFWPISQHRRRLEANVDIDVHLLSGDLFLAVSDFKLSLCRCFGCDQLVPWASFAVKFKSGTTVEIKA